MKRSTQFREWRRGRPFVGCLLLVLAGVEMFFSTQLDVGNMHIQLGVEGFQATVIPIGFVLLGVLIAAMPQHRIFYGVIALALSLYSIIGVNLGGFIVGMLLSAVGGILAVSWAPATADAAASDAAEGSGETVGDAASPDSLEPERELVGAVAASSASSHPDDGKLHAEFVPYPSLVARTRPAKADDTLAAPPPFSTAARTGVSGSAPERKARASGKSARSKTGTGTSAGTKKGAAAAAALIFLASITGIGAAAAPSSASAASAAGEPSALCLPILMTCPSPTPSPSPSASPGGGLVGGLVGGLLGGAAKAVPGAPAAGPLVIGPDTGAYTMTLPAGQLGGSSISISGIHQVGLVTVKKIDGTSFPVIKMVADDVTITGFSLDVRRATGPSLVSTADRMELNGNVNVWLDSLTGTTLGGLGLTLGTDQTPPPGNELPSTLLRINLGLVATSANSITYSNLHQALHE